MATRAIKPKRDDKPFGGWQSLPERAPSVLRADRPFALRIVAFAALVLTAVGGLAMILPSFNRPYLIDQYWGLFFFSVGVLGLIYHVVHHTAHLRSVPLRPEDVEDVAAEVLLAIVAGDYSVLRQFRGLSSLAASSTGEQNFREKIGAGDPNPRRLRRHLRICLADIRAALQQISRQTHGHGWWHGG